MTGPLGHGSLADEAVQLVAAAQAWVAREVGREPPTDDVWSRATTAAAGDDGCPECTVCPLCRSMRFVRNVRPEAVEQLVAAGTALVAAVQEACRPPATPAEAAVDAAADQADDDAAEAGPADTDVAEGRSWD